PERLRHHLRRPPLRSPPVTLNNPSYTALLTDPILKICGLELQLGQGVSHHLCEALRPVDIEMGVVGGGVFVFEK
ncbi:hypothetical protein ACF1BS_33505, partial [Streptomyces sp. NPDC014748]